MSDARKYYCFCDANCKHETMTKEQILAAIAQLLEGGAVYDPDAAVVSKVKESNAGQTVTFWRGTAAQYNAIEEKDPNCFYIVTDDTTLSDISNIIAEIQAAANNALVVANDALGAVDAAVDAAADATAAAEEATTKAASAQTTATTAKSTATVAQSTANAALPKAGGTMTGKLTLNGQIVLKSGVNYGDELPAAGTAGRLFFKKV